MSKKQNLININHKKFKTVVESCTTRIELCSKLNIPNNGVYNKIVNELMSDTKSTLKPKTPKYKTIVKECPVCGMSFDDYENHPRPKTTCSYACSNKHFRSGRNNGNYDPTKYRNVCFEHHKKECIICAESRIVDVHHHDGDHGNINPSNLIPLCPTHHTLYHSRFRGDVLPHIEQYRKTFIESYNN